MSDDVQRSMPVRASTFHRYDGPGTIATESGRATVVFRCRPRRAHGRSPGTPSAIEIGGGERRPSQVAEISNVADRGEEHGRILGGDGRLAMHQWFRPDT
jgi:hypothetical protein